MKVFLGAWLRLKEHHKAEGYLNLVFTEELHKIYEEMMEQILTLEALKISMSPNKSFNSAQLLRSRFEASRLS